MRYLVASVCAFLFLINVYASVVVLRARLSSKAQKAMQLGFVWLLPLIGAPIAVQILRHEFRATDGGAGRAMRYEWWWDAAGQVAECDSQSSDASCD
jgi:hypothetical protein